MKSGSLSKCVLSQIYTYESYLFLMLKSLNRDNLSLVNYLIFSWTGSLLYHPLKAVFIKPSFVLTVLNASTLPYVIKIGLVNRRWWAVFH
jgi:hypothetical protein